MNQPADAQPVRDIITNRDYLGVSSRTLGTSSDIETQHFTRSNDTVLSKNVVSLRRREQPGSTSCMPLPDEAEELACTEQSRWLVYRPNDATPGIAPLDKIIEDSRAILELELDEDEATVPYTEETWKRAVEFLRRYSKSLSVSAGHVLDAPRILPGPDGSIDIHWDEPKYEMLINIPADPNVHAGFYGDDRGAISMKGTFNASRLNPDLHLWLERAK